ncbi:MAG: peptidyl-prolyl cis-trans isomerase [Kordiimonadaceae bacterium]|nr:peptidyl-prolyl cis-trans isomerase [Kordiimonadaceae bacterium]
MKYSKWTRSVLKEPLLHFLLIGGLAFLFFGGKQPSVHPGGELSIVISIADQQRISATWFKQWGRAPSEDEFNNSLAVEIRRRILFQEASALNLQVDDLIVQRRLVQKLEYMQEAMGLADEPNEERMLAWFQQNVEDYRLPSQVSFGQIFFDTDKRTDAFGDAKKALPLLLKGGPAAQFGDQLPETPSTVALGIDALSAKYGPDFTGKILKLKSGMWAGPIKSGLGVHLIKIQKLVPGKLPRLSDVRQKLLNDYMYARRKQVLADYYAKAKEKYLVKVEAPLSKGQEKRASVGLPE